MLVFPMAGASRRFSTAGYAAPKFMLPLRGQSVFWRAVSSFRRYFDSVPFLFLTGPAPDHAAFVAAEVRRLGIRHHSIRAIGGPTRGQAETVALGLAGASEATPLTIFNIDTFRPDFTFPEGLFPAQASWLEVFPGSGPNWSYVLPSHGPEPIVCSTAEKRQVSNLCCTGLYHFRGVGDFQRAFERELASPQSTELYVAPLYNHLIGLRATVYYRLIPRDEVVFCGTPQEYEDLVGRWSGAPTA
jgi:hypothetical protein